VLHGKNQKNSGPLSFGLIGPGKEGGEQLEDKKVNIVNMRKVKVSWWGIRQVDSQYCATKTGGH